MKIYKTKYIEGKLKIIKNGKIVSDNELLGFLKQFYQENGRVPKARDFYNSAKYPLPHSAYLTIFGTWNKALKLAGLQINYFTKAMDEELLEFLKQFYQENGRVPSRKDFNNNPKYPSSALYKKIGWHNALRLAGLDKDILIKNGFIKNTNDKGRLFELYVKEHFPKEAIDLAGENQQNPYDGICPTGQMYDAKSSEFRERKYYSFNFKKIIRDCWYYLGGFSKNYEELLYVWRVPGNIIEEMLKGRGNLYIGLSDNYTYNITNMRDFNITDKFMRK